MSMHEQISSPIIQRAYQYVMSTRCPGDLPARSGIDPLQMGEWLDHTELLDVINGGEQFRYRIAGGEIERIFHSRMNGKMLEDIFTGSVLRFKLEIFRRCVQHKSIILSNDTLERGHESILKYERILIPLSEDGIHVNMLFGCIYPMEVRLKHITMSDPDLSIIAERFFEEDFS